MLQFRGLHVDVGLYGVPMVGASHFLICFKKSCYLLPMKRQYHYIL